MEKKRRFHSFVVVVDTGDGLDIVADGLKMGHMG
jgi:hypothetical protein